MLWGKTTHFRLSQKQNRACSISHPSGKMQVSSSRHSPKAVCFIKVTPSGTTIFLCSAPQTRFRRLWQRSRRLEFCFLFRPPKAFWFFLCQAFTRPAVNFVSALYRDCFEVVAARKNVIPDFFRFCGNGYFLSFSQPENAL